MRVYNGIVAMIAQNARRAQISTLISRDEAVASRDVQKTLFSSNRCQSLIIFCLSSCLKIDLILIYIFKGFFIPQYFAWNAQHQ